MIQSYYYSISRDSQCIFKVTVFKIEKHQDWSLGWTCTDCYISKG